MIEETNNNYVVYVHTTPTGMQYFGVTKNAKDRWCPSKYKNGTLFKDAIIEFGWKNIKHQVVASGLNKSEALKLENELIATAKNNGTSLNMNKSGYYTKSDARREDAKSRSKAFREANPDYQKNWRESHREEYNSYMREYHKRKKEQRNNNNDK